MLIPSALRRGIVITGFIALLVYLVPARAADKEPTVEELKARVKELEAKAAELETKVKDAGLEDLTPEEQANFKKFLDTLPPAEQKAAEADLAQMSAAERLQVMHRIAGMSPEQMQKAKKRSEVTRVIGDMRLLDAAIDQYAIDTNRSSGMHPSFADLKAYLKAGTTLYTTGKDVFGHAYGPFTVDSIPRVPEATFNALSDVTEPSYWSPFH